MSTLDDDGIGYRRPPKKTQFKPGQSGNPKGRPKGSKNMTTILQEELDQKIPVTEGGKRRRVTKRRLAVRQQVNKAAQGDSKAFLAVTRLEQGGVPSVVQAPDGVGIPQTELTEDQYLAALLRFRQASGKGAET
jgi:hypothetical protein